MFPLPDYWMPRPAAPPDAATLAAFDRLLAETLAQGANVPLEYTLPAPKWQFLCHVAEHHAIALHGSSNPHIDRFEPRRPHDLHEFGAQHAVYAAADGIWAMLYAILDREQFSMSLANACIRLVDSGGMVGEPYYLFSISRTALVQQPWCSGAVYLLPRATFVEEPVYQREQGGVKTAQLASLTPVVPLARLTIHPQDFPFLTQIRGHDDERLALYARAMQTGAPWPDDAA